MEALRGICLLRPQAGFSENGPALARVWDDEDSFHPLKNEVHRNVNYFFYIFQIEGLSLRMDKLKKSHITHLLIFLSATLLYALCQMLFGSIMIGENLRGDFVGQLFSHYVVIIAMCIADYGLLYLLNRYIPYSRNVLLRILADLIGVSLVSVCVLGLFSFLIYNVMLIPETDSPSFLLKFVFAMTNNIPILLVLELIYYFKSEQKAVTNSEKAKREALMFEHETLRAQINPHFLFNSLNVLSSLIFINPDNANKFTKSLSKTYRYILSLHRRAVVSVDEDLDALDSYMFLMRMRFEDAFTFRVTKLENCGHKQIIPLTLQLLVENVFKHNVATKDAPLIISIDIKPEYIEIRNTIRLCAETDNSGIGLEYLSRQYLLHGRRLVVSDNGETFTVKIPYIE